MFQSENSIHLLTIGIPVLCTVFQLSESQSVKKEMTFYKAKASWNTASNVCRANGGRLLTLDSQLKIDMVERLKTNNWNSVVNDDYWIGLFDASIGSGTYTWSDCTRLDDTVTNWPNGEPDHRDTDHCVRNTKYKGHWRTKGCNKPYQFICEKILGYCASKGGDCFIARTDKSDIPECLRDDSNTPHGCYAYGHMSSSYTDLHPPVDDLCKPTSISPAITSESLLITSFDPGMSQTPPLHTATSPNTWHTSTPTSSLPLYRTPGENQCSVKTSSYTDVTISNTVSPSSTTPKENSETATQNPKDKGSCCPSQKKTVTAEESFAFMSKILKDLQIQKHTLSSYRRKRISAYDDRLIARVEGYIGIVTLAAIVGGIFILDLPALSRDFMMMLHRIRDVIQ